VEPWKCVDMPYDACHLVVMGTTAVRIRLQSRQARPVAYSRFHDLKDRFQNAKNLEESKQCISNVSIHVVFVWQSRKVCFDVEPSSSCGSIPNRKKA
jgi:hypothetical protein